MLAPCYPDEHATDGDISHGSLMALDQPSEEEIALAISAIASQPVELLGKLGIDPVDVTVDAAVNVWGHRLGHLTSVHVEFVDDTCLAPGEVLTTWEVRLRRGQVHAVDYRRSLMRDGGKGYEELPPFDG